MSLGKRHIGRRVAGVGVAVALMMLGLQAPAFAVLGTITFTPASGPADCVIVITGTDFQGPDVDSVQINLVDAEFEIQSDTEIWATANGETGFVTVSKSATGESVSSGTAFTDSGTGAGDCASTITSFTPTCGTVGTTVSITGTNLIQDTGASTYGGADVEFSPFTGRQTSLSWATL
jgi:IPT/TIG domain